MRRRRWAWWTLIAVVLVGAVGLGLGLPTHRRTRNLEGCTKNLKDLGTALEMYSTDYGGLFPGGPGDYADGPGDLSRLVGSYIKHIPTCPAAGRDTYSEGYVILVNPNVYTVCCSGTSHPGIPANYPMYCSTYGLCLDDPLRITPLGGRLPPGVELDGVALGMTLEQVERRLGAVQWTESRYRGTVGGRCLEFQHGILTSTSGKRVTCPQGSLRELDPKARVREVLGTPTARTWDGITEQCLFYTDEATSTTLRVYVSRDTVGWMVLHRTRKASTAPPW